jgi:hypothetical protein
MIRRWLRLSRAAIRLSSAYVHVSEGSPGVAAGDGYVHAAELIFEASSTSAVPLRDIGVISDGWVSSGSERLGLLQLPFAISGRVEAELQFVSGAVLRISAESVRCFIREPGRWVEPYAG